MTAMTNRDRILAKRAAIAANRSKGLRSYKFKAGKTKLRILPMSTDPSAEWDRPFGKTYLKTFDGKSFFGIVDRQVTYGEHDVIRDMIFDAMRQAPDEDTKKHYRDMLAGDRRVFNALILSGDPDQKPDEPVIIEVSETQFDTIMAQFLVWSEDDPDYDLAGLKTGHIFEVEKTGQGIDTKYVWQATPKQAPLSEKVVEKAHDLDAWIKAQVEGLEDQAIAFISRLNAAVGIETNVPTGTDRQLEASDSAKAKAAAGNKKSAAISDKAVTEILDDEDVEDAAFEEVEAAEETDAPDAAEPDDTPDEAPTGTTDDDELEAILAGLGD